MNRPRSDIGPTDAALLHQAQRGRQAALAELIARYQDRVYNTCYRLCQDPGEALDLAQTTFMRAIQALPRFEQRANFYTWLFRIAVNLAFSRRRAERCRQTLSLDQPSADGRCHDPPAGDNGGNPGHGLEREETRQRVEAALARLDPQFRVAVVLKDVEDMDYAAIAEILAVPVGTVKSRIYRGRAQLRVLLAEERTELGVQPS